MSETPAIPTPNEKAAAAMLAIIPTCRAIVSGISETKTSGTPGHYGFILNIFQEGVEDYLAISLLIQHGLRNQTHALVRQMMEIMFRSCAVTKDTTFINRLNDEDLRAKIKLGNAIIASPNSQLKTEEIQAWGIRIQELTNQLGGRPKPSVKEIAITGGEEDLYNTRYSYYCGATHGGFSSLLGYFDHDPAGRVGKWRLKHKESENCFEEASIATALMFRITGNLHHIANGSPDAPFAVADGEKLWSTLKTQLTEAAASAHLPPPI
jgi:hypothetical protein